MKDMKSFDSNEAKSQHDFGRASQAMRHTLGVGVSLTLVCTTVLAVAFAIALDGCSSKEKQTTVSAPNTTIVPAAPLPSPATLPDAPAVTTKKKAPVWVSTLTYKNPDDGVTFRYPRTFKLMPEPVSGNSPLPDPVPVNFSQPGGVTLATIGQTGDSASSFFKVSVHQGLTQEQCWQFANPSPEAVKSNPPVDPTDASLPIMASVRGVQYSRVENATEQTDVKYFHHFVPEAAGEKSGACYEFALGVEESANNTKPVDYMALFDKMERILTTVKIPSEQPAAVTASVTKSK
ncbi:MAG: hypothetical protein ACHP79_09785 [Terriglobales bacterium]